MKLLLRTAELFSFLIALVLLVPVPPSSEGDDPFYFAISGTLAILFFASSKFIDFWFDQTGPNMTKCILQVFGFVVFVIVYDLALTLV